MASTVSDFAQAKQLIREFGIDGQTLKLALVDSTYVFSDADTVWADMSGDEITGTGYTAGGETLTGVTVTPAGAIDADNVVWSTATITFRRGILYFSGTIDGKVNPVLFSYLYDDTPADVSVTASDFTHIWSTSGIVS